MLLELTREGDYAVRAMLALARHDPAMPLSRRQIAAEWQIPAGFLAHALAKLSERGLIVAVQGRSGGYRLGRDPSTITLYDVVESVEELPTGRRCITLGGPCPMQPTCVVHDAFAAARESFISELAAHTLASIVAASNERAASGG